MTFGKYTKSTIVVLHKNIEDQHYSFEASYLYNWLWKEKVQHRTRFLSCKTKFKSGVFSLHTVMCMDIQLQCSHERFYWKLIVQILCFHLYWKASLLSIFVNEFFYRFHLCTFRPSPCSVYLVHFQTDVIIIQLKFSTHVSYLSTLSNSKLSLISCFRFLILVCFNNSFT